MIDLAGTVTVVTGGNGGIGLGLAVGVAKAGGDVAIWARDVRKSAAAVAQLESHGARALAVSCDITNETAVAAALHATIETFGDIDSLIANAGIADQRPLLDTSLAQWQHILRTNLDGTFLCIREVGRHLVERGQGGAIVLVSSIISRYGAAGQAAYATSKAGLISLGRTAAVEFARHRIRCNVLIPGWVETQMNDHLRKDDSLVETITKRTPVRRWASPEELHEIAAFLVAADLTFHTGAEVVVDGGYTIF